MTELKLPLSNVQIELLKLFATDLSEEDLTDLKLVIARFFAQRSIKMADQIWEEKDYTDEDMDKLLNAEDQ